MPEMLEAQLQSAQRRLWAVETAIAILGGLCGLLASYLLLFVSDRFWATPAWLRFAFTATGIIGAALGTWWWASHQSQRRDLRATARLIQKRYPRLGDRLLSIVELSHAEQLPATVSQTLVNAAMRQVASESQALSFETAVPTHWLRRWTPAAIVVGGLTIAALVLVPSAGLNAWKRWTRPLTAEDRFTFTQLRPLGSKQIVAYGEPFGVAAELTGDSKWRPATGRARVGRQAPVEAKLAGNGYQFTVPGQTRAGDLAVAVGDARESTHIEPMFRPDLAALSAEVELPSYLEYPAQLVDARKGAIDVLEGSRLSFTGKIGRPLQEAFLTVAEPQPLTVRGATFSSEKIALAPETKVVKFTWRDEVGLSGRTPFELKVQRREDEAPAVDCRGLERATAILEDETLDFRVEAEDDFGVKKTGLKWQVVDTTTGQLPKEGTLPGGAYDVATGKPQARTLAGATTFSPKALGIGPGRVVLQATALDYKPDRAPAQSAIYTVLILDRSEHAKLVQQMMDKLAQQLEELARTEQQQVETSQRLREELAKLLDQDANNKLRESLAKQMKELNEKLQAEKAKADPDQKAIKDLEQQLKALKEQMAALDDKQMQQALDKLTDQLRDEKLAEQANREAAKQAAEEMQKLAKEALRNDQIPTAAMKQMAEIMQALQKLMQGEMQQAQQALQNAQGASHSAQSGQRSEQMAEAQKQQQEAMERLQKLAQQMQKAGQDLMAETFVNRLKASAKNEKEIGGELGVIAPRTVGATLAQLEPDLRGRLLLQKSKQDQTQKKVKDIKDDIAYFLRRQPIQELHEVHEDMDKVSVTEELGKVSGLINNNLTAQAIDQTGKWEKQLLAWAEKIKGRDKNGGGGHGGGGGGGEIPPWVMELIFRLARVRQQEEDIREQTRAVEERRVDNPKYEERAKQVGKRQDDLLTEFDKIPEDAKVPPAAQMRLAAIWEQVDKAMADAIVTLNKPDTGGEAIAAQTEVIELIGKLLDSASQGGGGGGGGGQMSQQQMAMLQQMMQMMGMGMGGNSPGGNPQGGGTNQGSPLASGRGDGTGAGERRIDQAGGRDTASLPVEFREALEGYYNAVDKTK
jgi:hypothetical protein